MKMGKEQLESIVEGLQTAKYDIDKYITKITAMCDDIEETLYEIESYIDELNKIEE